MADLEIRAFRRRFLVVWEKRQESKEDDDTGTTAGSFSPAGEGDFAADDVMAFGFRAVQA